MFKINIEDTERNVDIEVSLDIKMSSETSMPLSMITTPEALEVEIDRLKYNLLELLAKRIMNERNELNV